MPDQQDPWLAVGDPVDNAASPSGAAHAPAPIVQPVQPTQAAPDAFAQVGQPVSDQHPAQLDNSGTQYIGGFPDQLPDQPKSKMAPADEAAIITLLRAGHDDQAAQYAASKGFTIGNADEIKAARDKTGRVNPDATYDFPKVDIKELYDPNGDLSPDAASAAARGLRSDIPGMENLSAASRAKLAQQSDIDAGRPPRDFAKEYAYQQDVNKAVERNDESDHFIARTGGQLVGALGVPTGVEGLAARVEAEALHAGASAAEARTAARIAIRNRLAATSGAYSGAHGALDADSPGGAVAGAVTEGGLGALTGGVLGHILPSGASRPASAVPAMTEGQSTFQAAQRIGLDDALLPADTGGPVTRAFTSATEQTPFGAGPIINAAKNLNERGAEVLQSKAAELGDQAQDVEGLGTAATEGALKYNSSAKRLGGRMYDAAVAKGGNVMVDLQSARDTLDSQISRLSAIPGGGQGLEEAQALRSELDKPFTVQGIRDWRTEQFIDPKFRNTPVEGRMKAVVNAASRDVETALRSSGNTEAADMYAAADNHWREMLVNLRRNVEPIIGKLDNLKSAEGVASALNSASKNNGARLGSFLNSLPDEQRGVVNATLLSPLGRNNDGAFSVSRFATDWAKMSPIAKRAAFPPELRSALDDLATVGSQAKAAGTYAGHFNTGRVLATLATGAAAIPSMGTIIAGQYGMGRLLASPRFARWLARAPKTALSTPAYLDRLSRIARAEPAIANQILGLQQKLEQAFASSASRATADEPSDKPNGGQGNAGEQQPQNENLQP